MARTEIARSAQSAAAPLPADDRLADMAAALREIQTGLALMHHGQGGEWFSGCPTRSVAKVLSKLRELDKCARAAIAKAEG